MIDRAAIGRRNPAWRPGYPLPLALGCLALLCAFSICGCKSRVAHTSDPRLQKIDEMLNAQLPQGTPRSRVEYFLSSRGYQTESHDKNVVIAVVRHIDTDTLLPATARVTFHFDERQKLTSYELQSSPDAPLRP
jgi:hypothetical protein